MKKRNLIELVAIICSVYLTTSYFIKDDEILAICWFFIGVINAANLVRRIKASKKEDYERISDDNHTDDIHFIKNIFPWIHK